MKHTFQIRRNTYYTGQGGGRKDTNEVLIEGSWASVMSYIKASDFFVRSGFKKESITGMAKEGLYIRGRPFGLIVSETFTNVAKHKTFVEQVTLLDVSPWLTGEGFKRARSRIIRSRKINN